VIVRDFDVRARIQAPEAHREAIRRWLGQSSPKPSDWRPCVSVWCMEITARKICW
jgi:hypothetical protein